MTAPFGERPLSQLLPSTFAVFADPGFDADVNDPESNSRAAVNYARYRYGITMPPFDVPAADLPEQEWDWPRACPWCGVTVPVGVPTVLVDGEHVCQECAL